ncbi:MAG TPA: cupin domain-containing protein [Gaiellaceae bacterium]|nr:cupin domain-containing protein [Gaiellaceae bacterium]
MTTTAPPILGPDAGESVNLLALGVRFMVEGASTGAAFALVEHPLPPRALGAPVHTHANEDEYSYVLEGRLGIQLGDDVLEAGPGALVFKPRGVPHAFWNAGDEPLRILEIVSPAGFEQYFREMAAALAAHGPGSPETLAIAERYELEIDFSTVQTLAERHGLRLGE